ncbi:MAG: hypothetical protein RIB84_12415 [Sneathiellaceae bacterium]
MRILRSLLAPVLGAILILSTAACHYHGRHRHHDPGPYYGAYKVAPGGYGHARGGPRLGTYYKGGGYYRGGGHGRGGYHRGAPQREGYRRSGYQRGGDGPGRGARGGCGRQGRGGDCRGRH